VCVCVCVCACVCVCVRVCVCVCVWRMMPSKTNVLQLVCNYHVCVHGSSMYLCIYVSMYLCIYVSVMRYRFHVLQRVGNYHVCGYILSMYLYICVSMYLCFNERLMYVCMVCMCVCMLYGAWCKVCCSVLQFNALQHNVPLCSTLQHTATRCNTLYIMRHTTHTHTCSCAAAGMQSSCMWAVFIYVSEYLCIWISM